MYSILVYPNITYAKDLEKDSYVVVLRNVIKELNRVRDDLQFTILCPRVINALSFPNARQIPIQLPSYPNQMRLHFNSIRILSAIDWKNNDYDIVYSHLPEHTLQLKNLFYNVTNNIPVFIGYTHWTEFPEITNYKKTVMPINFLGLAEMARCGINTESQKKMILHHAATFFTPAFCQHLNKILEPQYLGWEIPTYKPLEKGEKKVIVFNHRPHKYKRYEWFLTQMDRLYIQRKDFSVWIPLASSCERKYIHNEKFDRFGYFSELSRCYVGVCAKQLYAGWSVSATDGMSVGVPYLFSDDEYYRELAGDAGIYYNDEAEFNAKINTLLDSEDLRNREGKNAIKRFKESTWNQRIKVIDRMFSAAIATLPKLKTKTESYMKMLRIIKKRGMISKANLMKEMGWGVRINITGYRNRLRSDGVQISRNKYAYKN